MSFLPGLYYCFFILIGLSFTWRFVSWIVRIHNFRKSMPVIPTLFQPDSPFRFLWPKRWQTFHRSWSMQCKRSIYRMYKSDIFALVCLFDSDKVYVADPSVVMEIKVAKAESFGRDMRIFRRVRHPSREESL